MVTVAHFEGLFMNNFISVILGVNVQNPFNLVAFILIIFMFSDCAELSMMADDVSASFSTSTEAFSAEDSPVVAFCTLCSVI